MEIRELPLTGLRLIEPPRFEDARGYFFEAHHHRRLRDAGFSETFVQDNISFSIRNVLRGLHFQYPAWQGKLVTCLRGEIFDVAVDLRRSSPTFGRWVGERLSAANHRMMWIPPGFAHGFVVLSDMAEFLYKATDYYAPEHERALRWNDPRVGIAWPFAGEPQLKPRDAEAPLLADAETFP